MSVFWLTIATALAGNLRYSEDQAPPTVNPLFGTTMAEARINELIFGGLFGDDESLATVPRLAESAELSPDRLTMTITLRSDITWQDGSPFTSKDVVFTIKAMKDPGTLSSEAGRVAFIKDVVAVDDHHVRISFVRPEARAEDRLQFKILPAFRFLLSLFADASGVYLGLDSNDSTGPIQTSVVRSLDGGNSWPSFSNGLATVNAPQEFGSGNGYVYVGTQNGVWRTVNTEAAWTGITDNLPTASKQVWDLAVSGDKVAVAFPNGCYLSLNRGASWSPIRTCDKVAFSGEALFVDAYHYDNGIVREGLFLTNDNGATWQNVRNDTRQFTGITRLHVTDNLLCVFQSAPAGEFIVCTADLGQTWRSFTLGGLRNTSLSTFKSETLTSIALNGNTIFLGTNPFGVYVSRDGGINWLPANLGLPQPLNVRELWIRGDLLYASSVNFNPPYGGNVFVRKLANEP